jgi:hypothetical protein
MVAVFGTATFSLVQNYSHAKPIHGITQIFFVQEIENDEDSDVSSDEEGDEGEHIRIAICHPSTTTRMRSRTSREDCGKLSYNIK